MKINDLAPKGQAWGQVFTHAAKKCLHDLTNSAICGYDIYKDVQPNPFMGEVAQWEKNAYNPFAMPFKKTGTVQ